jgi:hypothetical protein
MRISQAEATKQINAISDRYALNRYTVQEAAKDDEMGYLIECFLKDEPNLDNGRKVNRKYLIRKLKEFNRAISFQSSEAQFIAENRLVKQDTRIGQVYYESLVQEPAD